MTSAATHAKNARRVRGAAIAVVIAAASELISLRWAHPLAFLLFIGVSGVASLAGIVLFLSTLFRTGPAADTPQ